MVLTNQKPWAPVAAMMMSGVVTAQNGVLEEIIVSAQKRAQSLQDVPIAVSTLSGDALKQNKIANLEDVAAVIPNLSFSGSPGTNTVRIRGLGTGGANGAFEQSVGMYVDGIYAGRGFQFSLPYMDVERIEVLKGPQGVLFGKNSIAGAISITSARPTAEFEAEVGVSFEAEPGGFGVEAVINGELLPGLAARLAASYVEEGGWIDNSLLGQSDQPEVEMSGYRASLLWDATDTISVYLKYDHGRNQKSGSEFGIKQIAPGASNTFLADDPSWESLYQAADPRFGLIEDQQQSSGISLTDAPNGDAKDVESDAITLQVDWSLGEHTLTALSGYSTYEVDRFSDSSFAPLTTINQRVPEEFSQFTQELRLVSPLGQTFEYIAGLFYLDRSLELPSTNLDAEFTPLFGATLPAPAPPVPTALAAFTSFKTYDEDTRSIAAFGQLTWNISDVLRASLGLRYSYEKKEADARAVLYELNSTTPINPVGRAVSGVLFGITDHDFVDSRTEENVDPSLNTQWDINDSVMLYAAATKATKAGGYNSEDRTGNPGVIEFEPEEATAVELGMKGEFLDRQLRVNAALFHTEFDDLQVSVLDGNTSAFFIGNAAAATTQGLETDVTYALSEAVTVGGSLAYLDSYFNDFPGAPCATSIYRQADCVGDGPASSRNAEGETMIHSPDWAGSVYVDYYAAFTDNMFLSARLEASYVDDFVYNLTFAEPLGQDANVKWNARVSLASADDRWELALIARNLSDEITTSFGDNVPLSDGVYFSNVDSGRQVYLDAAWRF